jgi:hypothetical protein
MHEDDELLNDFRNFLFITWDFLRLPPPTQIQYDIANYLQYGPKRSIIQAFRGVGKSWITSAFVIWNLLRDPNANIMVVSASKPRADDFSTFVQRLIMEMPELEHLRPKADQRQSKVAFDVGPAQASHAPSVKSVGITGQLTGGRADIIIADDVEVPANSMTQTMRDKLSEAVKEFDAVLKPDDETHLWLPVKRIIYLGTPQTEQSLYNTLQERGYETRIWTARYPSDEKLIKYGERLAPKLRNEIEASPRLEGRTTEPDRFTDIDLLEREASYGRSGFALQFMLDTSLSDLERYPLRLTDLCVMDLDVDVAPEKVVWSSSPQYAISDLASVGMGHDKFYAPMAIEGHYVPYTGSIMAIDPSGRGQDEVGYAVVKILNSQLFLLEAGGLTGGYSDETLAELVKIAARNKVNGIVIESNFGDGMFMRLLQPIMAKVYPVTIEEVKHSKQKELRIIDTLEPVMNQHRLIVNKKVIQNDWRTVEHYRDSERHKFMLFWQMTRLTKDRGAIPHDDRLDAVAIAVNYWVEQMSRDVEEAMQEEKGKRLDEELEKFMENVLGYSDADLGRFGSRRDVWQNI